MSNSIKLVYLKQSILDPELKSSITDLGIGPKAYPEAIKLLHDRYNKPRLIHRQYCEELSSVASMPKSKGYIGRLASKGTHLMAGFQRLKMIGVSEVLTSTLEAAMPTELRHVWYTQTSKLSTTPPIENLVQFLREREDQERAEDSIAPVKSSEKSRGHKPKNRGSSHMTSAPPSASPAVVLPAAPVSVPQPREVPPVVRKDFPPCRYPCPLCQGEKHYPYHCETFKAYSPSQRNSHVQAHNLCVNCLKPGHTPSTCRSTYKCKFCSQAHNSLLHDNQANSSNPAVLSTNVTNTGVKSCIQDTLLTTAEVLLTGTNGVTLVARALLDSGSTLSIISTKTRKTLALKSLGSSVCIDGVGGAGSSTPCPMVNLHLSSSYRPDWHTDINAAVMCKVTRDIPLQGASAVRELPHIHPLHLADKHFDKPGAIDLLLGQDVWNDLFLAERITGAPNTPTALHTVFGWTIGGPYSSQQPSQAITATAHLVSSTKANQIGDNMLAKFWELEEPPKLHKAFTPEEQRVEAHYEESHTYLEEEGRYMVKLPKTPGDLQLGDSRTQAINRAKANERSLIRKDRWPAFQAVMAEYLELGHAQLVNTQDLQLPASSCYYMPVHSVYKTSSSSTKVRAVFDASSPTTSHISLNDLLAVGPTLQPSLDQTLLRFRMYPVAISGDISKMYREIMLAPEDQQLHRYIWREDTTQPWKDYQMKRVTFGVTSSP